MAKIMMTLADGTTMELSASRVEAPVQFAWGYGIVLRQPVTLNGTALPENTTSELGSGTVCQLENGETLQGGVKLVAAEEASVSLRVVTEASKETMLQAASEVSGTIGASSGTVGPFNYMVDIHLDMETPMASQFIVQLSCMGIQLADVHMDAQHPTATLGASIGGVGVTGLLGVDFERQRIYASATLGYFFGEKKYDFDLYHWGNANVQLLPMVQNPTDSGNTIAAAIYALRTGASGGSITVRNTGGYVAKFKVAFTLKGQRIEKESEHFTAGVNQQLDIPAEATDIQVEALEAWFIGAWSSIFTVGFDAPVRKTYEISGTTLNPSYREL